ncbi:MAG: S8 family serine peptidase [Caldimonas sp.]
MRQNLMRAATLAVAMLSPLALHTPLAQSAASAAVVAAPDARVIVKYRADSPLLKQQALTAGGQRVLQARALGQRIGVELTPGVELTERMHVLKASGLTSAELAVRLAAESDVEYAVPDERKHIVAAPSDPLYVTRPYNIPATPTSGGPLVGQWYLKPPGAATAVPTALTSNTAPSAINAEQAWGLTTGVPGVIVAVLDTGVRFDHPDLKTITAGGNLLAGYDMVSADSNGSFSTANDGNGRDADASDPGDWVSSTDTTGNAVFSACTVEDSSWHGTQTLGLIGAQTDNGVGIAGVARNVRVMPVRVLGKCGGYDSDIVAGMLWAGGIHVPGVPDNVNKATVLNLSLGGTGSCSAAYQDAVTQLTAAGVVVVASAGNSAGHAVGTPANCPGVISVAGLRHVGTKVGFSDLGAGITIAAPGGNCINITAGSACLYPIMTTSNAGTTTPVAGGIYTDSFNASLGTSFSSPLVAATVALMRSAQPSLTPAQVKSILQATARPFPTAGGTVNVTVTTPSPTANMVVNLGASGPPQCTAPTGTDQLECYCTTGTCGAGMVDTYAAVSAAAGGSAMSSFIGPRTIFSYQWTLVDGGGIVSALTNAASATPSATPTGAGTFVVSVTTIDDAGGTQTATQSVTVAAAGVTPPPVASQPAAGGGSGGSGGSGGGAVDARWLVLLLCAVLALGAIDRRDARRAV